VPVRSDVSAASSGTLVRSLCSPSPLEVDRIAPASQGFRIRRRRVERAFRTRCRRISRHGDQRVRLGLHTHHLRGQKVTIKEASSTTYEDGAAPASRCPNNGETASFWDYR